MPPHWIESGVRINASEYLNILKTVVKLLIDTNYPQGNFGVMTILAGFWPWTMWPPSSPNVNPLDYGIWGAIESKVCHTSHPSRTSLKTAIEKQWVTMDEDYVRRVRKAFRLRLEAMIAAIGGHFEK